MRDMHQDFLSEGLFGNNLLPMYSNLWYFIHCYQNDYRDLCLLLNSKLQKIQIIIANKYLRKH